MPQGGKIEATKERPEAVLIAPSPGLTDSLEGTKERLMSNHIIPSSHVKFAISIPVRA